ncbi:hypothetical protein A3Q56_00699 [Intoshia linei]|uniref:Myb-like domain-containing protein n=1 Tax=Intoshia linei TaxID=1819745 RepID=A0A177BB28_9BILA|nr:hypothetical protein A3Q56_00699 [Intoshia linei]
MKSTLIEDETFNSGRYSSEELKQLSKNIDLYCKDKDLQDRFDIFNYTGKNRIKKRNTIEFYSYMCKGLNRRKISVYNAAHRMCLGHTKKGQFTKEEIEKLIKLHEINGNNWVKIGIDMGRNGRSVQNKMDAMQNSKIYNSGKWNEKECTNFLEAIAECKGNNVSYSDMPWDDIILKVKTRSIEQCKNHWVQSVIVQTRKWNPIKNYRLIKRIYKQKPVHQFSIDWKLIEKKFKYKYQIPFLQRKFKFMKSQSKCTKKSTDFQEQLVYIMLYVKS